jgi:hypothetical protein
LGLWLCAFPKRLAKRLVDFKTILEASDKAQITLWVVERALNELKYKKVQEWFAYLEGLANLGTPGADAIGRIAEIKASRDLLVHNRGIVSSTYVAKAGIHARHRIGERLEISRPTIRRPGQPSDV